MNAKAASKPDSTVERTEEARSSAVTGYTPSNYSGASLAESGLGGERGVLKPFYQDAVCTIYCGDSKEILPLLTDVDGIVTDPPYGVAWDTDYTRFTTGFDVECKVHPEVIGDAEPFNPGWLLRYRHVVMWGASCYSDKLPLGSWLVWDKRFKNGTAFLADGEAAWLNKGHGLYIYSETSQGCIRNEPIEHPTQKPVGLMRWCIERVPKAKLICDPYMGSGSTLVAAKELGRKCIGIEMRQEYCEIAVRRLAQGALPLFFGGEGQERGEDSASNEEPRKGYNALSSAATGREGGSNV